MEDQVLISTVVHLTQIILNRTTVKECVSECVCVFNMATSIITNLFKAVLILCSVDPTAC